jgi:uroporphyrinogen decarboxylase
MRRDPLYVKKLLEFTTSVVKTYAQSLVACGADGIVILEPNATGGMVSPKTYKEFSKPFVEEIRQSVKAITVLHICGNTTPLMSEMILTDIDGISIDSMVDIVDAVRQVRALDRKIALMGNIDPVRDMLFSKPEAIKEKILTLRRRMSPHEQHLTTLCHVVTDRKDEEEIAGHSNYIVSSGCDLSADVPLENVAAFMEAGRMPV